MNAAIEKSESRKKKVWIVLGVGALAAAIAGGGALTTLYTSINNNEFRTTVADSEQETEGALLVLHGERIDYDFDSSTHNDQVQGLWYLENRGAQTTSFDGTFELLADIDQNLAATLVLQYGLVNADGETIRWRDAGTLADPASFATVTGIGSIDGGDLIPVHVRVLLEDPSGIAWADPDMIGTELSVVADFTVSYLDPLGSPRP